MVVVAAMTTAFIDLPTVGVMTEQSVSQAGGPADFTLPDDGRVDVVDLTRQLVRFNTTNPPGGTRECLLFIRDLLARGGIESTLLGRDREKPSLIARIRGLGRAQALLLHAHCDVVPTAGQDWAHDPFAAVVQDGLLFGRGVLDMKGQLAMMIAALIEMRQRDAHPAGDVVLVVVPDEETGGDAGARELVTRHRALFDGVGFAVGEDGGAFVDLGPGAPAVHPVVVAEKRACWMRVTLRGPGGHGSRLTSGDTAVRQLGRVLSALRDGTLEHRVTSAAQTMVGRLAAVSTPHIADALRRELSGFRDARLPEEASAYLRSVTHHTAVITAVTAPSATNVRPSQVQFDVDGRLLPGSDGTDDMVRLLRSYLAQEAGVSDIDIEVLVAGEPLPEPDLGAFYRHLLTVAERIDPGATAVPMITTASTDARLFAQLGIACYGWLGVPGCAAQRTMLHEPNEHLPVAALQAGAGAYLNLLMTW